MFLSFIDSKKTFEDNIIYCYLATSFLVGTFLETTWKEEISKTEYGNEVLMVIEKGAS